MEQVADKQTPSRATSDCQTAEEEAARLTTEAAEIQAELNAAHREATESAKEIFGRIERTVMKRVQALPETQQKALERSRKSRADSERAHEEGERALKALDEEIKILVAEREQLEQLEQPEQRRDTQVTPPHTHTPLPPPPSPAMLASPRNQL